MKKELVEVNLVLMVTEDQKEAFDKMLFDYGILQMKTLNGNIHNVEVVDIDVMDGEDYIFEVNEKARPMVKLPGEVISSSGLAI